MTDETIETPQPAVRLLSPTTVWVRDAIDLTSYAMFKCLDGDVTCIKGDAMLGVYAAGFMQELEDEESDVVWAASIPAEPVVAPSTSTEPKVPVAKPLDGPGSKPCSYCYARPGEPCVTSSGNAKDDFHAARE